MHVICGWDFQTWAWYKFRLVFLVYCKNEHEMLDVFNVMGCEFVQKDVEKAHFSIAS